MTSNCTIPTYLPVPACPTSGPLSGLLSRLSGIPSLSLSHSLSLSRLPIPFGDLDPRPIVFTSVWYAEALGPVGIDAPLLLPALVPTPTGLEVDGDGPVDRESDRVLGRGGGTVAC